jgi:hypothetical protein
MSSYAKKNIDFLRFANCCTAKQRKDIIASATSDQIRALCECADNLLRGNVTLSSEQKKKLAKHKHLVHHLVDGKIGWKKKRATLNQHGGSIPLLLASVLPALVTLLRKQ